MISGRKEEIIFKNEPFGWKFRRMCCPYWKYQGGGK